MIICFKNPIAKHIKNIQNGIEEDKTIIKYVQKSFEVIHIQPLN